MKFAFLLDNPQTIQTLFTVIRETSSANINSDVYLVNNEMDMTQENYQELLERVGNNNGLVNKNISWKILESREHIQDNILSCIENYDAVVGINLYNPVWQQIYGNSKDKFKLMPSFLKMIGSKFRPNSKRSIPNNIFGVEHAWNEMYNVGYGFKPNLRKLFCNTTVNLGILKKLGVPPNLLESAGSPWLQLCDSFGKDTEKENLVLFLAPHNSWVNQIPNLRDTANQLISIIRKECNAIGWKFVLKTRSKFMFEIDESQFDYVVSDQIPLAHLELYSKAKIAFHFCSSSVCEFAFTRTFSVVLFPSNDLKIDINSRTKTAKKLLHNQYYNKSGFLQETPFTTFYESGDSVENLLTKLILSSKEQINWDSFQRKYFPSKALHTVAGATILTQIKSYIS